MDTASDTSSTESENEGDTKGEKVTFDCMPVVVGRNVRPPLWCACHLLQVPLGDLSRASTCATASVPVKLPRSMPGLWSPPAGSTHCEFGLRWALTLEDLKKWFRERAPLDAFLVALEKGAVDDAGVRQPTTAGYHYAACTLPQLVALLETARGQPSQLNFYEVRTLRVLRIHLSPSPRSTL